MLHNRELPEFASPHIDVDVDAWSTEPENQLGLEEIALDAIKLLEGMAVLRESVDREGVDERIEGATDTLDVDVKA